MSSSKYVADKLDDLTECPVCTDTLKEPRMLPCMHNFCLKCLDLCAKNKPAGSPFRCPVCRNSSQVPSGGFKTLPSNFFLENILELHRVSGAVKDDSTNSANLNVCEICKKSKRTNSPKDGHTSGNGEISQAARYCIDCSQKLCEKCTDVHRKMPLTAKHQLIAIGSSNAKGEESNESDRSESALNKKRGLTCDQHPDKRLSLLCVECKKLICVTCSSVQLHKNHQKIDLQTAAKKRSKLIRHDVKLVSDFATDYARKLENLRKEVKKYQVDIEMTKQDICKKAEEIKKLIDRNANQLLRELETRESEQMKEFTEAESKYQMTLSMLQVVKKYGTEVLSRGGSTDVVRMSNDIHNQANDLFRLSPPTIALKPVFLKPSEQARLTLSNLNKDMLNLIGIIQDKDQVQLDDKFKLYLSNPIPVSVRPPPSTVGGICVEGLGVLKDELYVIRSNTQEIQVCDVISLQTKRRIDLKVQIKHPQDLAVCQKTMSVYVCDWATHTVHRIQAPDGPALIQWKLPDKPGGLSVIQGTGNVLVTSYITNQLIEYSCDGQQIRTVNLSQSKDDNFRPWHALSSLNKDRFVVCRWHDISLVSETGTLIQSYGEATKGEGQGRLDHPSHLAMDCNGSIIVADCNNNRIKLLNNDLEQGLERDLLTTDHGVKTPHRLQLDTTKGLLYVGMGDGRLVAYRVSI